MVLFFLNLIPVDSLKLSLADHLVKYYPVIWNILANSTDYVQVKRTNEKIIIISVQVFCNENVINHLLEDENSYLLSVFDNALCMLGRTMTLEKIRMKKLIARKEKLERRKNRRLKRLEELELLQTVSSSNVDQMSATLERLENEIRLLNDEHMIDNSSDSEESSTEDLEDPNTNGITDKYYETEDITYQDEIIKNNKLAILGTDLTNILQHKTARIKFLNNKIIFTEWIKFVRKFNHSFSVKRVPPTEVHALNNEPDSGFEKLMINTKECLFQPLSYFLGCLEENSDDIKFDENLEIILDVMLEWLDTHQTGMDDYETLNLNIPLHRYLSAFINHGLKFWDLDLEDIMLSLSVDQLHNLISNPLLIQMQIREIRNSLWIRNGRIVEFATRFYTILPLCSFTADLDIFLIQACLTGISNPGDYLIYKIFQFKNNFSLRIKNTISDDLEDNAADEVDQQRNNNMVRDALNLMATILSFQQNIFTFSDLDLMKLEIVSALACKKEPYCTYSYLQSQIPKVNQHYDSTLSDHAKQVDLFKQALPLVTEEFVNVKNPLACKQFKLNQCCK